MREFLTASRHTGHLFRRNKPPDQRRRKYARHREPAILLPEAAESTGSGSAGSPMLSRRIFEKVHGSRPAGGEKLIVSIISLRRARRISCQVHSPSRTSSADTSAISQA